jgi:hypothetical protein
MKTLLYKVEERVKLNTFLVYVCIYVCVCVVICTFVWMLVWVYVCLYMCVYLCIHMNVYVCIYLYIFTFNIINNGNAKTTIHRYTLAMYCAYVCMQNPLSRLSV